MPQNRPGSDIVTTELVNRMGLPRGGTKRFAINRQVRVIGAAFRSQEATGFLSTATVSFPSHKECGQEVVELLGVNGCQDVAIGHLTRHVFSLEPEVLCQRRGAMTNPVGCSTQRLLACHFGKYQQTQDQ